MRAFATEVGIKRRERSAFCGKTRGGAAAAKLRGARRCEDACSTRRAIDAVFADVLRVAREPWTLGPPPDAVSRLTGPVGKMRRFFRAFAALHGVVGGHAEVYYERRASEPYDVTLLLPRAQLAVVAHWDAEDVAGAVAGLREVDGPPWPAGSCGGRAASGRIGGGGTRLQIKVYWSNYNFAGA